MFKNKLNLYKRLLFSSDNHSIYPIIILSSIEYNISTEYNHHKKFSNTRFKTNNMKYLFFVLIFVCFFIKTSSISESGASTPVMWGFPSVSGGIPKSDVPSDNPSEPERIPFT